MATPGFARQSRRERRSVAPEETRARAGSSRSPRGPAAGGGVPLFLQREISVGAANDPLEMDADRVSRSLVGGATGASGAPEPLLRSAGRATHDALGSSTATPLDTNSRSRFEPRFGRDFGGVRIHTDRRAASAADELGAIAFTHDRDIYFAEGSYRPESVDGGRLLAHELTHVAQSEGASDGVIRRQVAPLSSSTSSSSGGDLGYTPADPALQYTPASSPQTPQGPPVLWGLDMSSGSQRTIYASVAAPGHTLAEVATYMYGSPDMAGALSAANGGLPERLGPGRTLRLASESPLTTAASEAINRGINDGTILRSQGMPQEDETRIVLYRFSGGGQTFELTEAQFLGMMQGAFTWVERKARLIRDRADDGRWVHNDHIEGTNSVIRGISDWMGDTECPDLAIWEPAHSQANALVESLHDYHVTPQSQGTLSQSLGSLQAAAQFLDNAENIWRDYINATIEGAERTVHRLEIVRNVSFGVAAGIAGAVAAPAVFGAIAAAGGSTLVAGGAAIGAGTLAGAGTGAALEFTGATAGVGLSMAVTPGEQSFDWGYVGERTWEGTKSGAIQGGIGAAGALAAPGVSSALGLRMFGQSAATGTLTAAQQVGLRVATGAAIGLPSGVAGAAIENVDDVVAGRMTGGQYGMSMLLGGAMGAGLGGGMSLLPINGLYRSPAGEPITPRWMLNGPFSPLQQNFVAPPGFETLTASELPPLSEGYQWTRLGNTWEPISVNGPMRDPVTVRLYGPDANGRYNYVVWQGDHIVGSRAFTRPQGSTFTGQPGANRWNFPMSTADYAEAGTGQPFVRGHNVDFADTIDTPGSQLSTMDPMNYTPEQADWGLHVRRILVGDIRTAQGAQGQYRQMEFFDPGSPPRFTTNGRRIPDGVFFAEYDSATGVPLRAWQVRWSQAAGFTTRASAAQFSIPVAQLPAVLQAPVSINAGVAGGAGSGAVDVTHH